MTIKHMLQPLALKALADDGTFTGYASVFGKLDHQNEIVAPAAFARSLQSWRLSGRMPAMLWMHDPAQPIGLWLTLNEDAKGLAVQGKLALRTQRGLEAYELLKLQALTGLSIGYRVVSSKVDTVRKARVLTDIDLFEISLVTFPANEAARVSDVKTPTRMSARRKFSETDRDATRVLVARLHQAARTLQNESPRRMA